MSPKTWTFERQIPFSPFLFFLPPDLVSEINPYSDLIVPQVHDSVWVANPITPIHPVHIVTPGSASAELGSPVQRTCKQAGAGLGGLSPQIYFQEQAEQQVRVRGVAAAGHKGQQDHGATLKCQGCTFQPVTGLCLVNKLDRPPLSFLPSQQLNLQY